MCNLKEAKLASLPILFGVCAGIITIIVFVIVSIRVISINIVIDVVIIVVISICFVILVSILAVSTTISITMLVVIIVITSNISTVVSYHCYCSQYDIIIILIVSTAMLLAMMVIVIVEVLFSEFLGRTDPKLRRVPGQEFCAGICKTQGQVRGRPRVSEVLKSLQTLGVLCSRAGSCNQSFPRAKT